MRSPAVVEDEDLDPGTRIGRWRVLRRLGQGAFGSVYAVEDRSGTLGALKVLEHPPGDEARVLARVAHPCVTSLLDSGGPLPHYLVMSLAPGRPLSEWVGGDAITSEALLSLAALLSSALAAVHQAGVAHGDVKPENILWEPEAGSAVLVDFGLSGARSGGTVAYAAPEVLQGGAPGPASDCYALALSLLALGTGEPPPADSQALLARRREAPAVSFGPDWLRELLESWLHPNPERRLSAPDAADRLEAHGVVLPVPDAERVRQRAAAVYLLQEGIGEACRSFVRHGGTWFIHGGPGAGKTTTLNMVARELAAEGRPMHVLRPTEPPWQTVEDALAGCPISVAQARSEQPALPGSDRVATAAARLVAHGATVLIDGYGALDPEVQHLARRLLQAEGLSVAITLPVGDETRPRGTGPVQAASLAPLGPEEVAEWCVEVLGLRDEAFVEVLHRETRGLPARLVAAVIAALHGGALVWLRGRWVASVSRLRELAQDGELEPSGTAGLSGSTLEVGAFLAAARRVVSRDELGRWTGVPLLELGRAWDSLRDLGWLSAVDDAHARCASAGARKTLLGAHPCTVAIHRTLLDEAIEGPATAALGWYLVGARDTGGLRRLGPSCLESADPAERGRLARAMWTLAPCPELALPAVRALSEVDALDDALELATEAREVLRDPRGRARLDLEVARLQSRAEDWHAALVSVQAAEAVLAEEEDVLATKATVHFRAGLHGPAVLAAMRLAAGPPPASDEQLRTWLRFRALWAQSAFEVEGVAAALEVLQGVPAHTGDHLQEGALLEGVRGRLRWHAGDMLAASAAFSRAMEAASLLPAIEHARLCNNAGLAYYQMGMGPEAIASWERALVGFRHAERPTEEVMILVNLCQGLHDAGRRERALQCGREAVERAHELDLRTVEMVALGNLGDVLMAAGDVDRAEARYAAATRMATEDDDGHALAELSRRRAEVAAHAREATALQLARAAVQAAERVGDAAERHRARVLVALARVRERETVQLDEVVSEAVDELRESGQGLSLAWVRRWASMAMLEAGRPDQAVALASAALGWAREAQNVPLIDQLDQVLGLARREQGRDGEVGPTRELLNAFVRMSRCTSQAGLFDEATRAAVDVLGAERAFVLQAGDAGALPEVVHRHEVASTTTEPPSSSILSRAFARRREVLATDIEERSDLRVATSVVSLDLRAAMCFPLVEQTEVIGLLYVDSSYGHSDRLEQSVDLLRTLAAGLAGLLAHLTPPATCRPAPTVTC